MKVIIINGPNLNLLKIRNEKIYGGLSFDDYLQSLYSSFKTLDLYYYQSNVEGDLINKLQEVGFSFDYIVLNAGGYSHSSVSIADCIDLITTPVIEVHISNIYAREEFRRKSLLTKFCKGSIVGLGLDVYRLALNNIIQQ
ncbi:MAG: 3-dehydroquinate dehydratase [Flavobacteriales bacterium TMED191]|nr:MAG: 3-dehydroquinate dehydratase [Flavobacteriales bacterium TMED191]|tara:strand:+ start:169 stop:588 length:420 start_codon:yes stop_codon:yes gene_type:complete